MTNKEFEEEKILLEKQAKILVREEVFSRSKSREVWLAKGDQNTKFFHNTAEGEKKRKREDGKE